MSTPDFSTLVARHRAYFRTGATRSAQWREGQLTALRAMMTDRAEDFHAALWTDLRRNRTDADLTDVKFLAAEADHALSHLRQWMKPLSVGAPPALETARVQVQFDPLGVGLIISTWNYPLMLTLSPLIAAISGGNAAVVKPSEVAPATADVIAWLLPEYLDRGAFSVVLGARPETTALLEQPWDPSSSPAGRRSCRSPWKGGAKPSRPFRPRKGRGRKRSSSTRGLLPTSANCMRTSTASWTGSCCPASWSTPGAISTRPPSCWGSPAKRCASKSATWAWTAPARSEPSMTNTRSTAVGRLFPPGG
jgi:hypothetical protein